MAKDRFAWADRGFDFSKRNLRVGTLWMGDAEGEVTISQAFDSIECPLMKADILKDILGLIQREYDAVVKELYSLEDNHIN